MTSLESTPHTRDRDVECPAHHRERVREVAREDFRGWPLTELTEAGRASGWPPHLWRRPVA